MSLSSSPGENTFKLSICFTVCHLVQFSGCWREVIWVIYSLSISSNSLAIPLWPLACSSRGLNIFLFSRIFSVNISNGYRKISATHLALTLPFSRCSVVGFELRPFDKWMKCFFVLAMMHRENQSSLSCLPPPYRKTDYVTASPPSIATIWVVVWRWHLQSHFLL